MESSKAWVWVGACLGGDVLGGTCLESLFLEELWARVAY